MALLHFPELAFLTAKGLGRKGSVNPFDLEIRKGEVVGLAGLLGSGRTEVAKLLFGVDKADQGQLVIDNEKILPIPSLLSIAASQTVGNIDVIGEFLFIPGHLDHQITFDMLDLFPQRDDLVPHWGFYEERRQSADAAIAP